MKKKGLRIVLIIFLCLIVGVVAYFGTLYLDKLRKGGDVNVTVIFDDTETYVIPSMKKMDKEEALKEWPYMMTVKNDGSGKGLYQIIISDTEKSLVSRDDLDYLLVLDDKEILNGTLSDIKEDVLYTYEIEGNKEQRYKLYIWVNKDVEKDAIYEYKLTFNTIKTGGPGF